MLSENVAAGTHQSSIVNQNKCDISNIYFTQCMSVPITVANYTLYVP